MSRSWIATVTRSPACPRRPTTAAPRRSPPSWAVWAAATAWSSPASTAACRPWRRPAGPAPRRAPRPHPAPGWRPRRTALARSAPHRQRRRLHRRPRPGRTDPARGPARRAAAAAARRLPRTRRPGDAAAGLPLPPGRTPDRPRARRAPQDPRRAAAARRRWWRSCPPAATSWPSPPAAPCRATAWIARRMPTITHPRGALLAAPGAPRGPRQRVADGPVPARARCRPGDGRGRHHDRERPRRQRPAGRVRRSW